ncbi:MAG: hypothetical protein QM572_12620 [Nocardioides sp.]|uniref:hypothetical protein n=1 Tax=Nocardioides sp. TaxID=35761 RepID=UPI0039E6D362
MADLTSRIEVTKLAHELGASEQELEFLADGTPEQLRELRGIVAEALFARHEERVGRLAALSKLLPVPLTAKIAELALGPMLSARVAGALDPREAARLAGHLNPTFLTDLSISLDPKRVAPIVRQLPDALVADIGRRLLAKGAFLVLGRFVAIVDVDVALQVVDGATDDALLQVALFTDDQSALDAITRRLDDSRLGGVIRAAAASNSWDAAVTILTSLSEETRTRLVAQAGVIDAAARDDLIAAIAKHDVWAEVLPSLHAVEQPILASLVNVESTLDASLIDHIVGVARQLDLAPVLVQLVLVLDDPHLDVLKDTKRLREPEVQTWLLENAGVARRLVEAVLSQLGLTS